jgi:glycosyltransferase involved in cell wall biosynthesis
MKILVISTLYPPHVVGGAEKAAALLAEGMVRRGHEVIVTSLHPGSEEVVEVRNGVRVYRVPMDNFYWPFGQKKKPPAFVRLAWHLREMWNPRAARRVAQILDTESPDVVHTHNICGFSLAVWLEIRRRNLRLVHTVHDYYLLCPRSNLFRNGHICHRRCLDCRLLTLNRRRLSRLPDAVVSVSRYALEEHTRRQCFKGVPATVIYNIQQETIVPDATARRQTEDDLIFGFIGRLEEEKGIETLLDATQQLTRSNWRLKIAGRGLDDYVQRLKSRFPDTRIQWLGFTDASLFYSSVDVVVIPSLWSEPLPYVCVETLHARKALICAQSGGLPEIAKLAEVAKLFPAGDKVALKNHMNDALAEPQRWKQPKATDTSKLKDFSEEVVVEKYLRAYTPRC